MDELIFQRRARRKSTAKMRKLKKQKKINE